MKKNILHITILLLAIILGGILINHERSQVRYVNIDCPYCGSSEVLDFGLTDEGDQRAHCFDCKQEYNIINQ